MPAESDATLPVTQEVFLSRLTTTWFFILIIAIRSMLYDFDAFGIGMFLGAFVIWIGYFIALRKLKRDLSSTNG